MTPTLKKNLSTRGFTLLEILVAMGLIAIVLTPVIQLNIQNINLHTETQLISTATFLANTKLAEVQSSNDLNVGDSSGDFGEDLPLYRYKQEIEASADIENLYKVTLTILLDEQETAREFVFETYIYRKQT